MSHGGGGMRHRLASFPHLASVTAAAPRLSGGADGILGARPPPGAAFALCAQCVGVRMADAAKGRAGAVEAVSSNLRRTASVSGALELHFIKLKVLRVV